MNQKLALIKSFTFYSNPVPKLVDELLMPEEVFELNYGFKVEDFPRTCPKPKTYIFFLYRDSNFYMRTPAVTDSDGLVPLLRVLRNPKYKAYTAGYVLGVKEAKALIEWYAHRGGQSVRARMRRDVSRSALRSFTRNAFMDGRWVAVNKNDGVDDDDNDDNDCYGKKNSVLDEEDWMLDTLMKLFPSEQLRDIAIAVRDSRDIDKRDKKTFLRNNTTDHTL